ncbi:Fimbrial protein-D1 [Stenotrophomonas sp. RIT309]|uniref:GspH/FimT family pseudopilin n=1 Tax=Stenotrophomonas TaxID=40323 RepID=UPI000453AB5B|nr:MULTISPECIES: GspH/FimT family pseudopilin [Stenotrophomonas]EZP46351.1 Fimbrial protein-D1 [Stenotrophomonas sp. RIT309]WGV55296.1 GspH/FimT family pseudopilin [Stenotrophomonas indicatrix]
MSLRRQNGFTLIELMVTLTVFVILSSIAYPSFRSMIRSNRLATANNEVIALTNLARSEAIRNNRGGGLCGSTDGLACDGEWSKGLLAWSDLDADGVLGSNDSVLRFSLGNPQLSVVGPPGATIAFDGRGRRKAADDQTVVLSPASCKAGEQRSTLTINKSGQVRVTKGTCS